MAEFLNDAENLETDDYEREVVDLDGEPYEIIDALEHEGTMYVALVPFVEDIDDEEEETEFIILKQTEEDDGEFTLETLDDDALEDEIGELFMSHFDSVLEDYEEN